MYASERRKGIGDSPEKVLSTDLMKNFPPIPHGDMEQVGDEALSAVAGGVPSDVSGHAGQDVSKNICLIYMKTPTGRHVELA
ncbi:MAG: hypothetical protein ACLSB9_18705 [Hydrogeniiclostridium mannosilyticum]